jgi:O6-methylguanine-DNA--protein-cysteine methyltransferase
MCDRPLNVAFVAPSAAGKNFAIDCALRLMPPEAYYKLSAASPRALVYSEESFEHRTVVMGEADSIKEDGAAASAIRAIADETELRYAVPEKDGQGRQCTREIVKTGPTGLLTTSTTSLAYQLGTRILEIGLRDDAEQTRAVLRSQGRRSVGISSPAFDAEPFIALQRYLRLARQNGVRIPYAERLAELVPSDLVRVRRDFQKLLAAIEAIALLHQQQRQRTAEGHIVATLDDYSMARELLASVFDSIASEGVTFAIRQTVEAVECGETVTQTELAKRLGVSKSTLSWRVKRAVIAGFLVNDDDRPGHSAELRRGSPLPESGEALPSVAELVQGAELSATNSITNTDVLKPEIWGLFDCSTASPGTNVFASLKTGPDTPMPFSAASRYPEADTDSRCAQCGLLFITLPDARYCDRCHITLPLRGVSR